MNSPCLFPSGANSDAGSPRGHAAGNCSGHTWVHTEDSPHVGGHMQAAGCCLASAGLTTEEGVADVYDNFYLRLQNPLFGGVRGRDAAGQFCVLLCVHKRGCYDASSPEGGAHVAGHCSVPDEVGLQSMRQLSPTKWTAEYCSLFPGGLAALMSPPEIFKRADASAYSQCRQSQKGALQCKGLSATHISTLLLQLCPCTGFSPCGAGGVDVSALHQFAADVPDPCSGTFSHLEGHEAPHPPVGDQLHFPHDVL